MTSTAKRALTVGVLLLLFVAAIAVLLPSFIRARSTSAQNACINNLRYIDGALQEWALEKDKKPDDVVTMSDLRPYMGRGTASDIPVCPSGGTYSVSRVKDKPKCSIGGDGHTLN